MKRKDSVKASQEMTEEREQPQGLMLATDDRAAEGLSPVGVDAERSEAGGDLGTDREAEREMRRHTRRSFLWAAAAAAAGVSGWRWLTMRREDDGIEGWSVVTQWAGARFVDFANLYRPATRSGKPPDPRKRPEDLVRYVSLATPDDDYYVGLDMESALHPQTLLCYEMNGKPLTAPHGAPLRLVIPVKYGIKNIKGIGTIHFTDRRPPDYWAERGYDWYAGHSNPRRLTEGARFSTSAQSNAQYSASERKW